MTDEGERLTELLVAELPPVMLAPCAGIIPAFYDMATWLCAKAAVCIRTTVFSGGRVHLLALLSFVILSRSLLTMMV